MKNCIVVGAGIHYNHKPLPAPGDIVIAVDGGYEYLQRIDIHADVIIGDFDSLSVRPQHPNIIELAKEKDDTDMLAALKFGLHKDCLTFHIYGGTGGRIDHTIANLQCLAYLSLQGAQGFLYGKDCIMTCIRNGSMAFDSSYRGTVSVFSHSDAAKGICLDGLKYRLHNAELNNFYPLGISNEFIGIDSCISVKDGMIIIIFPYNKNRRNHL